MCEIWQFEVNFLILAAIQDYLVYKRLTANQVHRSWLQYIQQNIWDRIIYESEMVPSVDALWRH